MKTFRPTRVVVLLLPMLLACGNAEGTKNSGELIVTVSAEALGTSGYAFPPTAATDLAFVDGWSVTFERILVAIDHIRLSEMPDRNPSDQSEFGADIAVRNGPFIVDLSKPGNAIDKGFAGKVATRLPIDDLKGFFDLEQRYAFSYALVPATADAIFVNVDADDSEVRAMIDAGERERFVGRAEFKGQNCRASVEGYDFASLPNVVDFRFGLGGKVSYLNCQNPDNTGKAIDGEESQRGIQLLPTRATTAQITIHTDHLFWPSVEHENLPHFDQFAANASDANGTASVDFPMLQAVPVPRVTDHAGNALPWRSCVDGAMYVLPTQPPTMTFDVASHPIANLSDFVAFNAATMGHLNADGLCYVKRN